MRSVSQQAALWSRFQAHLAENEASERSFGLIVGGLLLLLGLLPVLRHGSIRLWMIVPGVALVVLAAALPHSLRGIKRAWLFLGFLLGLVVNPVVLGFLFYGVITPLGLLMRFFGWDALRLHSNPALATYWRERNEPPSSMMEQF